MLEEFCLQGEVLTFVGSFNRRIEKNVDGVITRYVYDRGNIHLEYDGDNKFQAKYVHTDNVDEAVMMIRPDNPYRNAKFPVQEFFYHRDRLGNITEITDFEGTVVQRYVYDAFGKVSIFDKDGNAITPDSANYLKSPYAFTGREYDPETGCYYYRNRYYCPGMARYVSEDPIGFGGQDANLYRYVGNNSVNFVDPEGERKALIGICALAFAAGPVIDLLLVGPQTVTEAKEEQKKINKTAECKHSSESEFEGTADIERLAAGRSQVGESTKKVGAGAAIRFVLPGLGTPAAFIVCPGATAIRKFLSL